MNDTILILMTGGTIDSRWDGKTDTAVPNEHSVLPEYFAGMFLYPKVEFQEVCMKDSRQMTPDDVENVLHALEKTQATKVIITHGTYTMPDTARYLAANLKRNDQTIALTGSMVPLKGFTESDAPLNLGYAFAKLEELKPGIYLCMNGRTFSAEEVAKNISEGKFFSVFDKKQ